MVLGQLKDWLFATGSKRQQLSNVVETLKEKASIRRDGQKNRFVGGGIAAVVLAIAIAGLVFRRNKAKRENKGTIQKVAPSSSVTKRRGGVAINKEFFKNLNRLLRIVIPSWHSREALILLFHSFFLLARTAASVYLAVLDGRIVKALVSGQGRQFSIQIAWWLIVSIPIAFTNSAIRYLQGKLSIAFRTRLTNYVHQEYMSNYTYYKLENLDSRIKNADQCITQDVSKFCNSLAELYSNLAKPTLDCIIYNAKLAQNVGWKGLIALTLCIHTGTFFLRKFTPPFGKLIAEEQKFEGNFRFAHSRVITNAEEIAFYGGSVIEKSFLDMTYKDLVRHINKIIWSRLGYGTLEDYIVKYYWGALGFLICALPVFNPFGKTISGLASFTSRTKDFVTNRRLLLNTSDAFGRIMYSYKEVSELAGFTSRVTDMLNVFDDLKAGKFEKGQQPTQQPLLLPDNNNNSANSSALVSAPSVEGSTNPHVIECNQIIVENLSIVSPTGDVLVRGMSFSVLQGTHLLIIGPNGCGKSSLFRILGGLWPVHEGTIYKPFNTPTKNQIFYIPQRPYLSVGTLRDQVIYPHTWEDAKAQGVTDDMLGVILDDVKLQYIVEREGGWDAKADWKDVLSGGEKQRMAMARLFYHKPRYAILDECTSAVSIDVEGLMYLRAKELGISLMTVSHRPSLWKYHDNVLEFDGSGGWKFGKISEILEQNENKENNNSIGKMTLEEEKVQLEKRVRQDSNRLKKIHDLLGDDE